MKLLVLILTAVFLSPPALAAAQREGMFSKITPGLWNSFLFYNKENGAWEETTITITYFENLFQPFLQFDPNPQLRFRLGAGLVVPMNQSERVRAIYPYIQS